MYITRQPNTNDISGIKELYKRVAAAPFGIARSVEEITDEYVRNFMDHVQQTGVQFIIEDTLKENLVVAEIHCYKLAPKTFSHVLSELTIVVDPACQGHGLGKKIFITLLDFVSTNRLDILRVELVAQESNTRAIEFYKKIGFVPEGRFENRIVGKHGHFEADIPMAWFNSNYRKQ